MLDLLLAFELGIATGIILTLTAWYIRNRTRKGYTAIVYPSPEGGYAVECPDLPGCFSQGDTIEEALVMIDDARRAWLEVDAAARYVTRKRRKPRGLANPKKFEGSPASDIVSESRDF
jgi:predicted RNase H-like HicB family nuclease